MKTLAVIVLALLLTGAQTCDPPTPPPDGGIGGSGGGPQGGTAYCKGREYTILDSLMDGVGDLYNTIIGGIQSADRRATVKVYFGRSYCSGVALTPDTVLTAGHCGYVEGTTHRVMIEGDPRLYNSTEKLVHPDYLADPRPGNYTDLMLLYMDDPLPGPFVPADRLYKSDLADQCWGLIAQGYGQDEFPETGSQLREAKYLITRESEKFISSRLTPEGKICFGDSGGPLYADVGPGTLYLAGITSTTMSQDCLRGGTHVKLAPYFESWLTGNVR